MATCTAGAPDGRARAIGARASASREARAVREVVVGGGGVWTRAHLVYVCVARVKREKYTAAPSARGGGRVSREGEEQATEGRGGGDEGRHRAALMFALPAGEAPRPRPLSPCLNASASSRQPIQSSVLSFLHTRGARARAQAERRGRESKREGPGEPLAPLPSPRSHTHDADAPLGKKKNHHPENKNALLPKKREGRSFFFYASPKRVTPPSTWRPSATPWPPGSTSACAPCPAPRPRAPTAPSKSARRGTAATRRG
jgi:hypothetical protein